MVWHLVRQASRFVTTDKQILREFPRVARPLSDYR